jgi:hypothetical protein
MPESLDYQTPVPRKSTDWVSVGWRFLTFAVLFPVALLCLFGLYALWVWLTAD